MSDASITRILIVDDDAFNRDLLQQELEDLGHESVLASDGAEALAMLQAESIDVVLLDIMMPRLDGFAVLARLRQETELRDVPVIVISALDDLQSIARGIELGAIDYLPKPFEPLLLRARLDSSLQRRRWQVRERAYLAEIDRQRRHADDLLETLLPGEAIQELKESGRVLPRAHDRVAVMFLDIVGFSERARQQTPEQIVDDLTVFTERAEAEAEANGLEKIKLVGDAVMVTGNLLRPHETPVAACVDCAMALLRACETGNESWTLRGGLAYGPAVSGIIGRQRYAFDLWGHTVNTAARLVDLAKSGEFYVDKPSAVAGVGRYRLAERGKHPLKGVGTIDVFQLAPQGREAGP